MNVCVCGVCGVACACAQDHRPYKRNVVFSLCPKADPQVLDMAKTVTCDSRPDTSLFLTFSQQAPDSKTLTELSQEHYLRTSCKGIGKAQVSLGSLAFIERAGYCLLSEVTC